MRCQHCTKNKPEKGYCCEKAELETLRAVTGEVARSLDIEVEAAGMDPDMRPFLLHVRDQLKSARAGRAVA